MNNDGNEPIVVGTLKKEKSSKPFFVILCFIFLIGTCFGLPYIKEYTTSEDNSFTNIVNKIVNDILDKNEEIVPVQSEETKIGDDLTLITSEKKIIFEKIILSNISLKEDSISFNIANSGDSLINDTLFLELYSEQGNLLTRVRLIGSTSNQKYYNFLYAADTNYYAKVVRLTEQDYDFVENTDLLSCELENEKYTYGFSFNKLDTVTYQKKIIKVDEYLELSDTLKNIGVNAYVDSTDMLFIEVVDLYNLDQSKLGYYYDYNFYQLNSSLRKINYEMKTLGFDCK